ncbi:hypothetical protein DPMN_067457 [Dreissena polymorpha]|uniref:Uncharacterized protein n=1 Tax=Dreissena polymorpha TaxID=45954 RepID=A0A9D4BVU5_DREPO|nr:hypothetical protein DPMN_067457 [Dreissena polymorpha]
MHGPITNPGAHLGQTFGVGIRVGLCRAISSFYCDWVVSAMIWNREVPDLIPTVVGDFSGWVTLASNPKQETVLDG